MISSYKGVTSAANQANAEYEAGFKKLLEGERKIKKLQEDIALKNIQLSKKANIDKLQDVVSYYDKLQSEYKKDSEEYLKIEKKKLDAQIKLQKESDSLREKSRKAAVEDALKSQKALEAKQKALRDKIAARNKVRTKKVLDFEKAQADRRAKVLAAIERRKEKERTAIASPIQALRLFLISLSDTFVAVRFITLSLFIYANVLKYITLSKHYVLKCTEHTIHFIILYVFYESFHTLLTIVFT